MNPLLLLESEPEVSEMDESLQKSVARLEADVEHIRTNVADIKIDLREINARLGKMDERIGQVDQRLTDRIDGVRQDLTGKIDGVRQDLTEKIDGLRKDLTEKLAEEIRGHRGETKSEFASGRGGITSLRNEIWSVKVWALGLYLAQAGGLLFVMAKGFKWL